MNSWWCVDSKVTVMPVLGLAGRHVGKLHCRYVDSASRIHITSNGYVSSLAPDLSMLQVPPGGLCCHPLLQGFSDTHNTSYIELHSTPLHLITLQLPYTTLHYTTLHYTTLHYTTLHSTALRHTTPTTTTTTTLLYTTLHYITLPYISLH